MLYFAYGSNMSITRLRGRVSSARPVTTATLTGHALRFHKIGRDGSAKCDAYPDGNPGHSVAGVVYAIDDAEKPALDRAEGVGNGYAEKEVTLVTQSGEIVHASTYQATKTDPGLRPFHWYRYHVLRGARENHLPETYVRRIEAVESVADPDPQRHEREMAIYDTPAGR
jgi:gamma-glutamylcyclotransferase (GGCT)/AIG2-like uncharacterized protein YtfP